MAFTVQEFARMNLRDVSEYGYNLIGLTAGLDYEFIHVGETVREGDEWYTPSNRWEVVTGWIDHIIWPNWQPHRRKIRVARPKWSCGHGKDADDTHCIVCAVFYRTVTA